MSSAFFQRESKGMFVVVALAIWLGLLGLFGRHMPVNASVGSKQVVVKLHGNTLTSHWVKQNGVWRFRKISKITSEPASKKTAYNASPLVKQASPASKSNIETSRLRQIKKRAARARLATEIGRWAKIDGRWEWHQEPREPQEPLAAPSATSSIDTHKLQDKPAHWVRYGDIWVYETNFEWESRPYI